MAAMNIYIILGVAELFQDRVMSYIYHKGRHKKPVKVLATKKEQYKLRVQHNKHSYDRNNNGLDYWTGILD